MTQTPSVAIVRDPADPVAAEAPAAWAAGQLFEALAARGVPAVSRPALEYEPTDTGRVVLGGLRTPVVVPARERVGLRAANVAEELALLPAHQTGQHVTVAAGSDPRGLVYAILELADRVSTAVGEPLAALRLEHGIIQRPANPIRGV